MATRMSGSDKIMSMDIIRYAAAACQTDQPNPLDRAGMQKNTDRMLAMIDAAVAGSAPFLPVRLVVFPEFGHAAPVYATLDELRTHLAVQIPNEHTRAQHAGAPAHRGIPGLQAAGVSAAGGGPVVRGKSRGHSGLEGPNRWKMVDGRWKSVQLQRRFTIYHLPFSIWPDTFQRAKSAALFAP
jgi:hypothetical protein